MKGFANVNPKDLADAVRLLDESQRAGRQVAIAGGGSDLLGMIKERLVQPDIVLNLKSVGGLGSVAAGADGLRIGGLVTLAALGRDAQVAQRYRVLSEAANSIGTPQIRNTGTVAGNVCQRPWCWYLRNGFPCYKNGGDRCFAPTGENQFHSIFGGGPSFIVHPSDTAPALMALDASFRIAGPKGERTVAARDFFALPKVEPSRENVLEDAELLVEILVPETWSGVRGTYNKLLDRQAWTHAVVSAAVLLDMDGDTCRRARVVLGGVAPIPWDLPAVAALLEGHRLTPELAAKAGEAAIEGARPMSQNRYKLPLTSALVRRTLLEVASKA